MNWQEFFAMGGYAVYVWPSYGLSLAVLLGNWWLARQRARRLWSELARKERARSGA
ncbi:heme exporter protein CcmD [Alkalilimnicola sp. S0819]|uniref:heme exporter protein CcmD n=1 Tax=Alkalilimnicola sp. S0819 TaxID=2613922 RepID=UPI0012623D36|nr:heme exporter protein CcmD [Alkalilimnicola sp. S0819]KAB7627487.1 heme exporter protein CcmD [Alkalilimnicola sp. S0819]MPQ15640.1 heme exporter protein CcmD [Alkalilimnicola sp. S0819]